MKRRVCFSSGVALLVLLAFLLVSAADAAKPVKPPPSPPPPQCAECWNQLQFALAACDATKSSQCNKNAMDAYHLCVRSNGCS